MIVYLTGAPASGKTTLGRRLAAALGVEFVDLDEAIVATAKRPIPEIFAEFGEPYFRTLESATLTIEGGKRFQAKTSAVIALGGGTLLNAANRAFCEKTGAVFCLETPSEAELARRIGAAAGTRPLGDKAKERAAHYASFPSRVAAFFDAQESLVVVGRGIAPALLADRPVVADSTVASLYPAVKPFTTIPSGEVHKTPATVASLWHAFAEKGLGRKDVVCALGGGVTGDLTGFAAATWMRGIGWINFPTTLLSMVDASTGGKTGCDLPEGKNLAGAFHFPRLVVIDTDFLKTLPAEILRDGKAEMIKHWVLESESKLKSKLKVEERDDEIGGGGEGMVPSPEEIAANLMVKVGIVREDPFETKGRRLLLNCGHTVAHAIEKATSYRLTHGEAVAIGCVEEARIAVAKGLADEKWPDELAAAFAAVGLPTALPDGLTLDALAPLMKGDKKRAGETVTFALPCGWGDVRAVPIDLSREGAFA